MAEALTFGAARLEDQGKLAPFLESIFGPTLKAENDAAKKAAFPVSTVKEELLSADDFYFSAVDLMDCCMVAKTEGGALVGVACVNPYVAEFQYVAVSEAWRRKGVGRRLVEMALGELRRRGVKHARADMALRLADEGGRAFGVQMGFHEVRRVLTMGRKL